MNHKNYFTEITLFILIIFIYFSVLPGCLSDKNHYDMDDFYRIDKIDAHVHINHNTPVFTDEARKARFKLLTVNVDYPDFPKLEIQEQIALSAMRSDPDIIAFAATFYMNGWDEPLWQNKVLMHLDSMIFAGAVAVKVWKNIGMDFRNVAGDLIMIDDTNFDKIFAHLQQKECNPDRPYGRAKKLLAAG